MGIWSFEGNTFTASEVLEDKCTGTSCEAEEVVELIDEAMCVRTDFWVVYLSFMENNKDLWSRIWEMEMDLIYI